MSNYSSRREREELQELLKVYNSLKAGRNVSFIEEDDFERIIDYFDDKEDVLSALEAANIALQHFPSSAMLMFKHADLLIADKKYAEALDVLNEAEIYDSCNITLYILKTDAYLALEKPKTAAAILENALDIFEGDERIELLFELADVYDDYEEFEKVFDCLELILREDPNNEEALLKVCFWADYTGNCEKSIHLHTWITDEHPFNELAWFNLATAFQGLKLYEKAIDAYQYALAIDDRLDIAYRNMGDAYIRLRHFKEAIECLEKVLELSRPEDVIFEAIGHCYDKLKNYAKARFYYRKASHLNPSDARVYYKIASTYCNESRWDSAVKHLETAIQMQPHQADYFLLLGECKMEQSKLKEALQYFTNTVRLKPKNVAGREALIKCLLMANFYEEAAEQCMYAIEATNYNPLFYYYLSVVYFSAGKQKEVLQYLEKGLAINPRLFKKVLNLAPGLLQKPQTIELLNKYIKRKKRSQN